MNRRTRIKVCGITRAADARAAVAAGVDALGFIFVDASPRRLEPDQARDIISALPPFIDAVGVFMDADPDFVEEIIGYCGLTMVQLHGSESADYCREMAVRVIKSFRISAQRIATGLVDYGPYYGAVSGFLLDTYTKGQAGGTGEVFDWRLVEENHPPGPVILAGGLTPANVATAIQLVRPFAVDVSSGVELEPGVKDEAAINRLVHAVRTADQLLVEHNNHPTIPAVEVAE